MAFAEPEQEINRILGQGPIREYHLEGPVDVTVSFYRAGMELFFAGSLTAQTGAICARCAEEFDATADRPFRFVLRPRRSATATTLCAPKIWNFRSTKATKST